MIKFQQSQALTSHFESFWSRYLHKNIFGNYATFLGQAYKKSQFTFFDYLTFCISGNTAVTKLMKLKFLLVFQCRCGFRLLNTLHQFGKIRMQTLCSQLESKMSDERLNLLKMCNFTKKNTQCWIFRIFLSLRFYVKSILEDLEVLKVLD